MKDDCVCVRTGSEDYGKFQEVQSESTVPIQAVTNPAVGGVTFVSDVIVIMERPKTVVVMEIIFAEFVHFLLVSDLTFLY